MDRLIPLLALLLRGPAALHVGQEPGSLLAPSPRAAQARDEVRNFTAPGLCFAFPVQEVFNDNWERIESDFQRGRQRAAGMKVLFAGLLRNAQTSVKRSYDMLKWIGRGFLDYHFLLYEDDSWDYTPQVMRGIAKEDSKYEVRTDKLSDIIGKPNQMHRRWAKSRTQRMAAVRNILQGWIAGFLQKRPDFGLIVMYDFDLNWLVSDSISAHAFFATLGRKESMEDKWDMVCANSIRRHQGRSASSRVGFHDCFAFRADNYENLTMQNCYESLSSKMFLQYELMPVNSCFGGLALYKPEKFLQCRYDEESSDSEHVPLHECMARHGSSGRLFMDPLLTTSDDVDIKQTCASPPTALEVTDSSAISAPAGAPPAAGAAVSSSTGAPPATAEPAAQTAGPGPGACSSVCWTVGVSWSVVCVFSDCKGCGECEAARRAWQSGTSTSGSPAEPEAQAAGVEAELRSDVAAAPDVRSSAAAAAVPATETPQSPAEPEAQAAGVEAELRSDVAAAPDVRSSAAAAAVPATETPQSPAEPEAQAAGVEAEPGGDVAAALDVRSSAAAAPVPATETPQSAGAQPADVTDAAPQRPSQPPKPTRAKLAKAVGDPHLVNVYGQKFDILQPGLHTLIQVPKWAVVGRTLLTVSGDAQQMGGACTDMYFQSLNITGSWISQRAGLHFYAGHTNNTYDAKWMHLGQVRLKVVWGHTGGGTRYLNLLLKHLRNVKFPIGGLLGEGDHTAASTPSRECRKTVSL